MKTIVTVFAALLVATVVAAQCGSCASHCGGSDSGATTGGAQFDVRLATLAGDTVDLGAMLAQAPVAILQLGPGAASDSAARLLERWSLQDNSIPVLGSLCSEDKGVRKHVKGLKLSYPVMLDPDGELLALCKTTECDPKLVFVDQGGSIVMNTSDVTEDVLDQGLQVLAAAGKATDPVCGMTVDKATAAATSELEGETYYFCSAACTKLFDKQPGKYIEK